jgi:hypothetical protein
VFQDGNVEVHEKTDRPTSEPQIGQQLRLVDRSKSVDRLQLENHGSRYEKIETISAIQLHAFVCHGKRDLAFELQSAQLHLSRHALIVGRLEQSGHERRVHLDPPPR